MNTKEKDLLKMIANKLPGYWYNYTGKKEVLVFSLPDVETGEGEVQVSEGSGMIQNARFYLDVRPGGEVNIGIEKRASFFMATIKIITNDCLILQGAEQKMYIYERIADVAFADTLIDALEM